MPGGKVPSGRARNRAPESETVRSTRFYDPEGRALYFNILGPSMRPLLRSGDLLLAAPYRETRIKRGDVVVFAPPHEERLITHRIVSIKNGFYFARGDNNNILDPWPLTEEHVLGKVTRIWRQMRTKRIASGPRGRLAGFFCHGSNVVRNRLFHMFRPIYRWAAGLRIFRALSTLGGRTRIVRIDRKEGSELQLLLGRRLIGKLSPGRGRWWIRPPFRLLIDETRLPRPHGHG